MKKSIFAKAAIDPEFDKKLNDYARLLVRRGLNVQKGETIELAIDVKNYLFADKIIDQAYQAGAGDIRVRWTHDYLSHEKIAKSDMEVLSRNIKSDSLTGNDYAKNGLSILLVLSEDPELYNDVDPEKLGTYFKERSVANKIQNDLRHCGKNSWCIAAVPSVEWAKMVFPDLEEEDAVDKLWDCIFEATRVDGINTEQNWEEHISNLNRRANILNSHHFESLHYTNSLGTDLTIKLAKNHIWREANDDNVRTNTMFVPNIPTEEIFVAPDKLGVDGVVCSSKPLSLNGNMIDGIRFEFKQGKIVDIKADKGEAYLKSYISKYENADYLGEVALVPFDSAISNQNIVYYQTLFDENASCHLAFGCAFPDNIVGGLQMSEDQLLDEGINVKCDAHVDFMIGTKDLNITGLTSSGEEIQIFKDGNFTF